MMLYYFLAFSFFMALCFLFRFIYRKTENYISFVVWLFSSFFVVILLFLIIAESIKRPVRINYIYLFISAVPFAFYCIPMFVGYAELNHLKHISEDIERISNRNFFPILKGMYKKYNMKMQPSYKIGDCIITESKILKNMASRNCFENYIETGFISVLLNCVWYGNYDPQLLKYCIDRIDNSFIKSEYYKIFTADDEPKSFYEKKEIFQHKIEDYYG